MENNQLQKNLGLTAAISTVIGGVIGSGVFFKPQAIYTASGGAPGLGILGWIVAGIVTMAAGLTVAELAAVIPKTGGLMIFIEEIYGKKIGFVSGWVQSLLFFPGLTAAIAVVFGDQFVVLSGITWMKIPIAVAIILLLSVLNAFGSKAGSAMQNFSTICKMLVLAIFIFAGFILGGGDNPIISPMVAKDISPVSAFGKILLAAFFAFDGWINVTALAGEMKDPGRDLPKAIIGGISIVAAIYLILNVSFLWVIPSDVLANSVSPASVVAEKLFGPIGGRLIGVGIMISVFGACNAYIFTGSRVLYALALDGNIPKSDYLSKINKNNVPGNALLVNAIICSLFALSGQFNMLSDFAVFSIWIFIVLSFIGVIILRKRKPDLERKYKVPLYPIVPLIAILSGLFVLISQLISNTLMSLGGIFVMLLGVPVYSYMTKRKQ